MTKLYQSTASKIQARLNCEKNGNAKWFEIHTDSLEQIQHDRLPSGSGIDSGCVIDLDKSTGEKIIINSAYHAMDEVGYYDGWINFTVTITPSFVSGIDMTISGRFGKYADVKDYLFDVFYDALTADE